MKSLDPTLPLRSAEAAAEVAKRLRLSRHVAAMALRQWGKPLIRRSRRYTIYPPNIVSEIVERFIGGDWPDLGAKAKGGVINETH